MLSRRLLPLLAVLALVGVAVLRWATVGGVAGGATVPPTTAEAPVPMPTDVAGCVSGFAEREVSQRSELLDAPLALDARLVRPGDGPQAEEDHDFGDIRGRIVAADGTPLPGLVVRAAPLSELPEAREAMATSDGIGEFVLDQLTVPEYELWAQTSSDAGRAWPSNVTTELRGALLIPPIVRTPTENWADHGPSPRLHTVAGTAGIDVVARGLWAFLAARGPDGDSLAEVRIRCCVLVPADGAAVARRVALETERLRSSPDRAETKHAPLRVPVRGPVRLLFRASTEGLPGVEDVVEIAAGQSVLRHTFEFPSAVGFGALRVEVTAPDGRPLSASRITLDAVRTEIYDNELRNVGVEDLARLGRITPGRYRARITPHDRDIAGDYYLPFDVPGVVEIEAGRETHLEAGAKELGGRLEVTVRVMDDSIGPPSARTPSPRPRVTVSSAGSRDLVMEDRFGESRIRRFLGSHRCTIVVDPEEPRSLHHVLEPGPYQVRAMVSGFEPASTRVVIEPGRTATVSLTLTHTP